MYLWTWTERPWLEQCFLWMVEAQAVVVAVVLAVVVAVVRLVLLAVALAGWIAASSMTLPRSLCWPPQRAALERAPCGLLQLLLHLM